MSNFFSLAMLGSLLDSAAPLMLGSLGALFTELSGALGIFIEGFMSLGSFFAWIIAGRTGSVLAGTALAAVLAALAGWALARFVTLTGADPFIAGLALNLAAGGVTEALSIAWFGGKGVLRNPDLAIPGPLLGVQPSVYAAWGFTVLGALLIGRTRLGLRLRAAGKSPLAALERGLRPERYREFAWAAAAFLAALAGAALTFRVGSYAPGGIAGRGWICLAAVYLGFRRVWGVAAAALIFTLAERTGMSLQIFGALPPTALLGLPSALALGLYTVSASIRDRAKP
ncbi:MAG: ABC transporter permease [Treponema sp.]|jgi:simple sugar transport system permease protein|nr:ABC transporter permease [Treponema sp.]